MTWQQIKTEAEKMARDHDPTGGNAYYAFLSGVWQAKARFLFDELQTYKRREEEAITASVAEVGF